MIGVRRRLFWKVYLTLLASLVAVAFLMGAFWWLVGERAARSLGRAARPARRLVHSGARRSARRASPPRLTRLGDELDADVSVYDAEGALAASRGRPIPLAAASASASAAAGAVLRVDLADGRAVLARLRPPGPEPARCAS